MLSIFTRETSTGVSARDIFTVNKNLYLGVNEHFPIPVFSLCRWDMVSRLLERRNNNLRETTGGERDTHKKMLSMKREILKISKEDKRQTALCWKNV